MPHSKEPIPDIHFKSLARLESSYWWHLSRLNWVESIIKKNLPDPSSLNVLDYGCGTGGFLHQMKERLGFIRFFGVDTSELAIHEALKHGPYFNKIKPGDLSMLFDRDLIFLMDILEHIESDRDFFKSFLNQMKKGAWLIFSVPAHPLFYSSWDEALGHFRRYTKKDIYFIISGTCGTIRFIKYGFSYLAPGLLIRRFITKNKYNRSNCEFPPTNNLFNRALILLNRMEISMPSSLEFPFGSSLFALIQKE